MAGTRKRANTPCSSLQSTESYAFSRYMKHMFKRIFLSCPYSCSRPMTPTACPLLTASSGIYTVPRGVFPLVRSGCEGGTRRFTALPCAYRPQLTFFCNCCNRHEPCIGGGHSWSQVFIAGGQHLSSTHRQGFCESKEWILGGRYRRAERLTLPLVSSSLRKTTVM